LKSHNKWKLSIMKLKNFKLYYFLDCPCNFVLWDKFLMSLERKRRVCTTLLSQTNHSLFFWILTLRTTFQSFEWRHKSEKGDFECE
jgi:hypothetical protein